MFDLTFGGISMNKYLFLPLGGPVIKQFLKSADVDPAI